MKTLRGVAKALCLYHWDAGYDPAIDDMINEFIRMGWISGFLAGAQWREENPVTPGSVPDPESDPIELCGLLWDRDNLAVGGYEKDGHHYYVWQDAMYAAKSVGKRLPTREKWEALCDLGSTWDDERKGRWFGVITTRTTRGHCSSLLRACAATVSVSWPTRAPTATIGPRRCTTEATATRVASARAPSTR